MLHFSSIPDSTLLLLRELCAHPATQPFALTGGTALALRYGHRLSVDLDFFTPDSFDSQSIADWLTQDFDATDVRVNSNGINLMIRGVKVDFVRYRYALLQPFESLDGVRLFGLRDNIAMKLSAITNRGAKKDFYDLHQLIQALGLGELVAIYREKYPSQDAFILLRSLAYFDDAEDELDPESLDGTTWDRVQSSITKAVRAFL
jgi:predicted nucleotidyltransferase component of viral defense system